MGNDAIVQKIKKLLKHAESAKELGSLQEAEVFSMKAHELLLEHNLDVYAIAASGDAGDEFAGWIYNEEVSFKDTLVGPWRKWLIDVLVQHNLCSYTYNTKKQTFRVYGREENVDTVVYLYHYLVVGLTQLALKAHKNATREKLMGYTRYNFLKDFLIGAVHGLNEKFTEQNKAHKFADKIDALMVLNTEALSKFIKQANPNIKKGRTKSTSVGAAYGDGLEAGKSLSIGKPLGTTAAVERTLLT